jgi:hypothetical protein
MDRYGLARLRQDIQLFEHQHNTRHLTARRIYNGHLSGGGGPPVWFFDNTPSNFEDHDPNRVECVTVASPGVTQVTVHENNMYGGNGHVVRGSGQASAFLQRLFRDHRRPCDQGPCVSMHWDPASGVQPIHWGGTHTPARALREGVKAVLFDWDGTLSVCEGISTMGQDSMEDIAKLFGMPYADVIEGMVTLLFGGGDRRRQLGDYLTALHRGGVAVYVLTMNPVNDRILVSLLQALAPGIPRSHWTARRDPGYPGNMDVARFDRKHILHSHAKMDTISHIF